jgi:hypothetical protein
MRASGEFAQYFVACNILWLAAPQKTVELFAFGLSAKPWNS